MGKYDFSLDLESDNALKWVNACLTDSSIILEFGPANGRLTKHLVENRNCVVDIVEIDEVAGLQAAQFARYSLIGSEEGNIEKFIWLEKYNKNKYDYIIFADVLEHLYNPELVLEKCKLLLSDNGKIIFSVPNIAYNGLILNLLRDRFEYTTIGLLDDTHIRFFTYNSIVELVKKLNMHIVFQSAAQSQVGVNEVTGRYEFFDDFDYDIIKSHIYGEVYQFIIGIQLAPGELIDNLAPIADRVEKKYANYVKPSILLKEKEMLLKEKEMLLKEKEMLLKEKEMLLEGVLNSKSWRITMPLRWCTQSFKNDYYGLKSYISKLSYLFHKSGDYYRMNGATATAVKIKRYLKERMWIDRSSRQSVSFDENKYYNFTNFLKECETIGIVFEKEKLLELEGRQKVLLVSHELNLTGAPIALLYFAQELKNKGLATIIIAPRDDILRERACKVGIPVIVYEGVYHREMIAKWAHLFSIIVISTNVGAPLVRQLSGKDVPVIWWIHEAESSYHVGALAEMPEAVDKNIHVYCGGAYAERVLHKHRPKYCLKQLLYHVPDNTQCEHIENTLLPHKVEGKTIYMMAGMIEQRKGQDILVQAIRLIPLEKLQQCFFIFVGHEFYRPSLDMILKLQKDFPDNVCYLGEVNIERLNGLYRQMDCLICPSKDDPMPIVVTDALSLSKIVICSENTGSAALLQENSSGLIYSNDNPKELTRCILEVLDNKNGMESVKTAARKTYEKYFSREAFDSSVLRVLNDVLLGEDEQAIFPGVVSVVIPVFNGGSDLYRLLNALDCQIGVESVEVVVVDSGSKDGSVELAKARGVKVVCISQAEFSHSYARNLGASHAKGDYLLFMTQDACPEGPFWIRGMLKPILKQNVVAVSCCQTPRPGCDLLGRVTLWYFLDYMGTWSQDRILRIPEQITTDSLRKNAQLDDVSCLIRRDVFEKYHYRRNYAEDLDLGLRLIRDGYQLALLSSVKVIHSHTRPSIYHFKRGIVDTKTLKLVLADSSKIDYNDTEVVNCILTGYCVAKCYVDKISCYQLKSKDGEAWKSFCNWTNNQIDVALREIKKVIDRKQVRELITSENLYFDNSFQLVNLELLDNCCDVFSCNPALVYDLRFYIIHVLSVYFSVTGEIFNEERKEEICVMIDKLLGMLAGGLIGNYVFQHENEESKLNELAKRYGQGV